MKLPLFKLERTQSLWENTVEYNLTETGIHPFKLSELLSEDEIAELSDMRIGYGQTNGSVELRDAISRLYPGATSENILVTTGTIEANFLAMWRFLEPGDEIVLMLPNYMQIHGLAKAFGATINSIHLREELNWHFDFDEVRESVTPKTKMIVVCNPNNPTGAILSREEMQEIIRLAEKSGAWIYADEVYRGAELDGEETPSFFGLYDKTVVCCGLSKSYALPGLRLGWLVGPEEVIADLWAYHDYTSITAGMLSDRIATRVLQEEKRQHILNRNRGYLRRNLEILQNWLDGHTSIFWSIPPEAGGMAFVRYQLDINSTELSEKLRKEKSVFIVAGDCFGMDKFIRIGIGSDSEYFEKGLSLIEAFLEEIV